MSYAAAAAASTTTSDTSTGHEKSSDRTETQSAIDDKKKLAQIVDTKPRCLICSLTHAEPSWSVAMTVSVKADYQYRYDSICGSNWHDGTSHLTGNFVWLCDCRDIFHRMYTDATTGRQSFGQKAILHCLKSIMKPQVEMHLKNKHANDSATDIVLSVEITKSDFVALDKETGMQRHKELFRFHRTILGGLCPHYESWT